MTQRNTDPVRCEGPRYVSNEQRLCRQGTEGLLVCPLQKRLQRKLVSEHVNYRVPARWQSVNTHARWPQQVCSGRARGRGSPG